MQLYSENQLKANNAMQYVSKPMPRKILATPELPVGSRVTRLNDQAQMIRGVPITFGSPARTGLDPGLYRVMHIDLPTKYLRVLTQGDRVVVPQRPPMGTMTPPQVATPLSLGMHPQPAAPGVLGNVSLSQGMHGKVRIMRAPEQQMPPIQFPSAPLPQTTVLPMALLSAADNGAEEEEDPLAMDDSPAPPVEDAVSAVQDTDENCDGVMVITDGNDDGEEEFDASNLLYVDMDNEAAEEETDGGTTGIGWQDPADNDDGDNGDNDPNDPDYGSRGKKSGPQRAKKKNPYATWT
jgi:hypothetical protein